MRLEELMLELNKTVAKLEQESELLKHIIAMCIIKQNQSTLENRCPEVRRLFENWINRYNRIKENKGKLLKVK